jgi:hypothetical protein
MCGTVEGNEFFIAPEKEANCSRHPGDITCLTA